MDRLHILLYNIKVNVLKSEYKYETKNIKVGLVWRDLRRGYNDNTISSFNKEYLNNTSMRHRLTSLKPQDLNLSSYS